MLSKAAVELRVVGIQPAPQGSKTLYKGNFVESSKKLEPFRKAIGQAVIDHMKETKDTTPFTNPVEVEATFVVPRPPSVTRAWPSVMPDLDKYCRGLGDSISLEKFCGGFPLLKDDALIVTWHAQKIYGTTEEMGVYFTVREIEIPWHLG